MCEMCEARRGEAASPAPVSPPQSCALPPESDEVAWPRLTESDETTWAFCEDSSVGACAALPCEQEHAGESVDGSAFVLVEGPGIGSRARAASPPLNQTISWAARVAGASGA